MLCHFTTATNPPAGNVPLGESIYYADVGVKASWWVITLPQKCFPLAVDSRVCPCENAANPHRPQAMCAELPSSAAPLAYDFSAKPNVLRLDRDVYSLPTYKKPHTHHLDGANMGFLASSA